MEKVRTFEDLNCWKAGRELRKEISVLIKTFPQNENFELKSQMRRASRSVTHNIAEGYGRFHFKENVQFCRVSRGSLYELSDQLITAFDEGYIDEDYLQKLKLKVRECIMIINGYINYLKNPNKDF